MPLAMQIRKRINKQIKHDKDGVQVNAAVNAVVSANVGERGSETHASSRQTVVEREGRTVVESEARERSGSAAGRRDDADEGEQDDGRHPDDRAAVED